jgi:hypothetical protein
MANYQTLKDAIAAVIKTNGNQEITGNVMQSTLLSMINSLGQNYQLAGVAVPSTNPGTPDQNIFYVAAQPGTYVNFNNNTVSKNVVFFLWKGSWVKKNTNIPNDMLINSLGKIVFDNSFTSNLLPDGNGVIPDITITNGYYTTTGNFVENASFITKTFAVDYAAYYLVNSPLLGAGTTANIAFLDVNNNLIGAIRQGVISKLLKPSGAAKIALCGLGSGANITVMKYTAVTTKIASNAITTDKIAFIETLNKYNPNDPNVMLGYFQAGGAPIASASFNLTGYIPVEAGRQYVSSVNGSAINPYFVTFFYADGTIQSYISSTDVSTSVVTIPDNVINVRLSVQVANWNNLQFEEGNTPTSYQPYNPLISKDVLPKVDIDDVTFTEIEYLGKNILNPDKIYYVASNYISTIDGRVIKNFGYGYTDYLPINSKGLVITGGYIDGQSIGHAVYDANKNFIRGIRTASIEYQPGDAFVRFSILNVSEIMVEQATTATTPYEPYKGERTVISEDVLPTMPTPEDEAVNINLPDKIYAIVGDTLQLFFRGIIQAVDPYKYNIVVVCSKGNQYPRYWQYTPTTSDIGTTTFSITVKDNNRNVISTKSCQLITRNVVKSPVANLNVACFGDSLTSAGTWCAEADRRLIGTGGTPEGKQLSNIAFVGSKKNGTTGYFGVGGWTWSNYTTSGLPAYRFEVTDVTSLSIGAVYTNNGISFTIMEINVTAGSGNVLCSVASLTPAPEDSGVLTKTSGAGDAIINYTSASPDSRNPLWDYNAGKMTFIPYANKVAGGQIDVVYTLLTWNGLSAGRTDFSAILAQVKVFADTLHVEFPNAKMKIMGVQIPSVRGGMGASYGATGTSYADGYGMVVTAMNMNDAYQEFANQAEYSDFVEFVNVSSQFDTEYNMPHAETPVNTRNTVTEWVDTNGVHPSNNGYYQIGDIVYRNFVANFCQ